MILKQAINDMINEDQQDVAQDLDMFLKMAEKEWSHTEDRLIETLTKLTLAYLKKNWYEHERSSTPDFTYYVKTNINAEAEAVCHDALNDIHHIHQKVRKNAKRIIEENPGYLEI